MATSLLGIDALFAPIPGSEPGGPNPKTIRDKDPLRDPTQLDRSRREAVEKGHSLPVNDPSRLKQWRDLMKLAQDLFTARSKNLGWAIIAVDAAVRVHGFAGAREGDPSPHRGPALCRIRNKSPRIAAGGFLLTCQLITDN